MRLFNRWEFWLWLVSFFFMLGFCFSALAEDVYSCTNDESLPVSTGISTNAITSWNNMVEDCVIKQVREYEKLQKSSCPEERYVLFIDSCINRKCTKLIKETTGGKREVVNNHSFITE